MDSIEVINKCNKYTDSIFDKCKMSYGVVTSLTGGIYVMASWNTSAWDFPIKKLKHVTVAVNDIVLLQPLNGTYIIVGVIE